MQGGDNIESAPLILSVGSDRSVVVLRDLLLLLLLLYRLVLPFARASRIGQE